MFWSKGVAAGETACTRMTATARKVLEASRACEQARNHTKGKADSSAAGNVSLQQAPKQTIMSRLLEHAYPSDEHRISEILVLVVAGHETTSFSLCFLLAAVAQHPEVQRKLQKELDGIISPETTAEGEGGRVGAGADVDGGRRKGKGQSRPTLAQASQAEYLQWCINESMRLWPVAGAGSARTLQQDIEYKGMLIPKGKPVLTAIYPMFREGWIDRADEFIPERWSDDSPQSKQLKEMFMPFSLGKRSCVGQNMAKMQLKLLAANLFRYFEFELVEELQYQVFLTIKMANLNMRVRPRK